MAIEAQAVLDPAPAQVAPRKHIFGGQTKQSSVPGGELLPEDFGDRFRIARESAGHSVTDVAERLNVPASMIESFEEGARVPGYSQMKALTGLCGTTADGVIGRDSVLVNLAASFKGAGAREDQATKEAILLLTRLVQSEIELEQLLEIGHEENLPGCLPVLAGDVQPQAEQNAAELREGSGLGPGVSPVQGLAAVCWLEQGLGVRIHARPTDDSVRGVFVHEPEVGACVLLNADHPAGSLAEALAHALAHLCSFRDKPCVHYLGDSDGTRESAYAEAFARAFLMPRAATARKFREFAGEAGSLSRRHAVLMAHQFGVSVGSVFPRLSELGLADADCEEQLWGERITESEAMEVLGDAGVNAKRLRASSVVVPRLHILAEQAWRKSLRGEGQLSRMLDLDRVTLRCLMGPMEPYEKDAVDLR